MKRVTGVFTCYFDQDGCYDEWKHDIHNSDSCRSLIQDILLLPENKETEYTRIFVTYNDDTSKEITLEDIKSEGYIEEDWSTGKSTRTFSCCDHDCTKMTSWMIPKYCPWCGAKIKGERLKPCFHVDLGKEIDYDTTRSVKCNWGHGTCTAPNTKCPHWQSTFCELDKWAIEAERAGY